MGLAVCATSTELGWGKATPVVPPPHTPMSVRVWWGGLTGHPPLRAVQGVGPAPGTPLPRQPPRALRWGVSVPSQSPHPRAEACTSAPVVPQGGKQTRSRQLVVEDAALFWAGGEVEDDPGWPGVSGVTPQGSRPGWGSETSTAVSQCFQHAYLYNL